MHCDSIHLSLYRVNIPLLSAQTGKHASLRTLGILDIASIEHHLHSDIHPRHISATTVTTTRDAVYG
jgi:hypothetical protein